MKVFVISTGIIVLNAITTVIGGYIGLSLRGEGITILDSFTWVLALSLIPVVVSTILLIGIGVLLYYKKIDFSGFFGLSLCSMLIGFIGGAYFLNASYV